MSEKNCKCYDILLCSVFMLTPFLFLAPRHLVGNLPPYTNVSLKMILTNPEGRKESDETIIQTDEDGTNHISHLFFILFPISNVFIHFMYFFIKQTFQ